MKEARQIVEELNKKLKADVFAVASDLPEIVKVSTGLYSLDMQTGGGLPLGMPILLSGKKSTSKSAFCYYMAGQCIEQRGGFAQIVQAEPGFDIRWAEKCGLPAKDTVYTEASSLAATLDTIIYILKNEKPSCLILDSLSAIPADPENNASDSKSRGERAIPSNNFFRRLGYAIDRDDPPLIVFIEHLYQNVGGMPYEPKYITTGGETKGYMAVLEIRFSNTKMLKGVMETDAGEIEIPVEATVGWTIQKGKTCPKGGNGTFSIGLIDTDIVKAGEITDYDELLNIATMIGAVKKAGAWFSYGEEKVQGIGGLRQKLSRDDLFNIVSAKRQELRGECSEDAGGENSACVGGDTGVKRGRKNKKTSGGVQVNAEETDISEEGVAPEN